MTKRFVVKSFNGIGDALFVGPTFRRLKEKYPDCHITFNTNRPQLYYDNPYVDTLGGSKVGVFLGYADPIHAKAPTKHHIQADFDIVCDAYDLHGDARPSDPELQPELYCDLKEKFPEITVGVQTIHKGHWHKKKVWPFFDDVVRPLNLALREISPRFCAVPIPSCASLQGMIDFISQCHLVLCAEGGVSHVAKAIGTDAVVIYGGFARPEWNGYHDQHNICVCDDYKCSPCYNQRPCVMTPERACMRSITVGRVVNDIVRILTPKNPVRLGK